MPKYRLPGHVGFIPDGNRRWAEAHGMTRPHGYEWGIRPGLELYEQCKALGIPEASIYGFTQDNTHRPQEQQTAFTAACVNFVQEVTARGAALLVLGDETSSQFPSELRAYRVRQGSGMHVNLLINYDWAWDLAGMRDGNYRSAEVPRLDLVVRWGGAQRLSGFLPVQSVYADFFFVPDYWPDFEPSQFEDALAWYSRQDRTLGG